MAQFPFSMDMDMNTNIIRERSAFSNKFSFRESSTHSITSSILYHKRMEIQNNLLNENIYEPIGGEKTKEKKTKKGEDNGSKKGSRRVGDLE